MGLGDASAAPTATRAVQTGAAIGTPVLTGVLAAHAASTAAATGSAATILGMTPALAIPIIGAAIVGITIGITALLQRGCGQTCIVTSQWANQAEDLLKQNISAYFSLPAPRTYSQQQAALNNFEVVWARLQQLCGQQGTGDAGVRCITDRQAGSCKWRQTSDSQLLQYPGEPGPGQCWNWINGYRDPIANDPNVISDAAALLSSAETSAGAAGDGAAGSGLLPAGFDSKTLLLLGAGALILYGVMA